MKKASKIITSLKKSILLLGVLSSIPASLFSASLRVTIENPLPSGSTVLTPFWFGLHDGSFDTFTVGESASLEVERIAEDGNNAPLRDLFAAQMPLGMDFVLTGPANLNTPPLLFPHGQGQVVLNYESGNPNMRYISFLSMVLPSNDAFIGNDNPQAYPLYDANGNFIRRELIITGDRVYDAGTEVNDEIATNVPLLGQETADSGIAENGVISDHPGFQPGGAILTNNPTAFFNDPEYPVVRIIIEQLPVEYRNIEVEVTNLAPEQGTILTPFWLGLHDGSFDHFDAGSAASTGIERIAEDGNAAPLSELFAARSTFGMDTVLTGPANPNGPPLFFQGQSNSLFLTVDANSPAHSYLSFASMILPSNDAFIGNDDPLAHKIYNQGFFTGGEFTIYGSSVYDAGTEVNDEAAQNVPVLGQAAPNTGTTENSIVTFHPGFAEGGPILTQFPNATFTENGYKVARINVYERYNPWVQSNANTAGIKGSSIFGSANDSDFPWVNHVEHGPLFFDRSGSAEGFWALNTQGDLGWIFTSEQYYPLVFRESDQTWYRYEEGSSNPRRFENQSNGEILEVE
jgi:hypothetical protein